jgi:hypothetical protein
MREDEQGLSAAGEAAPPGTDPTPVPREETGETLRGAAGQIDGGRVDKRESSRRTGDLGRDPVYQELSSCPPPGRRSNHPSGRKRLSVLVFTSLRGLLIAWSVA